MIEVNNLKVAYDERVIVNDFSFSISPGEMLSIIGPNGCGKSTVLKAVSKFLKKKAGTVYLDGVDMKDMSLKSIAQKMAVLSQYNRTPEDITIEDLVYYGRIPHKKWYERKSKEDEEKVDWAIVKTKLQAFRKKSVLALSGGEKQRVWIAMALAQNPKVLLLDEPTTYLDISHQLEIMELIKSLNQELGLTVVMVLHDLSQAVKYSTKIVVIKSGDLIAEGKPMDVVTKELIKKVYNVDAFIGKDVLADEIIIHPIRIANSI